MLGLCTVVPVGLVSLDGVVAAGRDTVVGLDSEPLTEDEFGLAGLEDPAVVVFLDGVDVGLLVVDLVVEVDLEVVVDDDLDVVEPLFPLLVCAKASD